MLRSGSPSPLLQACSRPAKSSKATPSVNPFGQEFQGQEAFSALELLSKLCEPSQKREVRDKRACCFGTGVMGEEDE